MIVKFKPEVEEKIHGLCKGLRGMGLQVELPLQIRSEVIERRKIAKLLPDFKVQYYADIRFVVSDDFIEIKKENEI